VLGWISRQRFHMVLSLLPPGCVNRMLEIGYGSGVFMPELAARARELFGLDIHEHEEEVSRSLEQVRVQARLFSCSAERMPFPDGHFDVVVGVSFLEFISDLDAAAREMVRVLAPHGALIVVRPNQSKVIDLGFRLLTGKNAEEDFQGARQRVLPILTRHFEVEHSTFWPPLLPLYQGLRLLPRTERPASARKGLGRFGDGSS
jgi:ubiquinone/menaquinone biosynthesis C-methylase UbiE